jgi:hypothetical protein
MLYMGDDFSRQTAEPTKVKVGRYCPDCGEPLPDDPQPVEDICCQCNCVIFDKTPQGENNDISLS